MTDTLVFAAFDQLGRIISRVGETNAVAAPMRFDNCTGAIVGLVARPVATAPACVASQRRLNGGDNAASCPFSSLKWRTIR